MRRLFVGALRQRTNRRGHRPRRPTATSRSPGSSTAGERLAVDQSHVRVQDQYEAVGHAVRAVYTATPGAWPTWPSRRTTWATRTRLAVESLWGNIVHKKYATSPAASAAARPRGVRRRLLAAPERVPRVVCQLRRGVLPVQAAPRLPRRAGRRPVRNRRSTSAGSSSSRGTAFYYTNPLDAPPRRDSAAAQLSALCRTSPSWTWPTGGRTKRAPTDFTRTSSLGGGRSSWPTPVEVVQATRYRWAGQVRLTINPATPATFVVRIRLLRRDVSSLYSARFPGPIVAVNGVTIAPTASPATQSARS